MHNFSSLKNRAINELWDMNKRATQNEPQKQQNTAQNTHNHIKNLSDSFRLSLSNDDIIIVGLVLILAEDCPDNWLFLALLYILM